MSGVITGEYSIDEQWKHGGKCRLCRRVEYCTKLCREAKNREEREIYEIIDKYTDFSSMLDVIVNS